MFDEVIVARAVQFVVTSFIGDYACLRVELFGGPCSKCSHVHNKFRDYIRYLVFINSFIFLQQIATRVKPLSIFNNWVLKTKKGFRTTGLLHLRFEARV